MLTQLCISIALVPAAGLSPQEALNKTVTFKHAVASVRTVVDALGKVAGVKLSAAPAIKNEIVYLNVKDVKLLDVMNRLGDAVSSDWTAEADGFSLARSNQKVKRDEDLEYQQRLQRYTKALAKKREELGDPINEKNAIATIREMREIQKAMNSKGSNYNPAQWKKYEKLSQQTPGRRAMVRLITSIGAQTLAAIKPTDRVVFATSPTRMQRPLPNSAVGALNDLAAEQSAWASAHAALPDPSEGLRTSEPAVEVTEGAQIREDVAVEVAADVPEYISMHDPNGPKRPFKRPPAKAFLIAEPQNMGMEFSQLTLVLHVCDADGNLLLSSRDDLSFEDMADMEEWSDPKKVFEVGKSEKPIEMSPIIKDLEQSFGMFAGGEADSKPLSDAALEVVCNPDKSELLDLTNTAALDAVAEMKKMNVIAVLPDMMFFMPMMGTMAGGMKLTPSVYLKVLTMPLMMKSSEKDGWLTVMPISPFSARLARTDREALGLHLRRARKDGRVTLDNAAEFALKSGDAGFFGLADMLLRFVLRDGNMGMVFGGEADRKNYLRLYGSLTPSQRQMLSNDKGRILLSQLTPYQQGLVATMVYGPTPGWGSGSSLEILPEESAPSEEEAAVDLPENFGEFSVATEPTQALPNGLTTDGYMTMRSEISEVIFAKHADQRWGDYPQDIESLAFNIFAKDHPDKFPWITEQGDYVSFQVGRQTQLTFTFHFTTRLGMNGNLNDHEKLGKPGPMNSLPPDVLKKINDAVKRQAEMHKQDGGLKMPDEDGDGPPPGR